MQLDNPIHLSALQAQRPRRTILANVTPQKKVQKEEENIKKHRHQETQLEEVLQSSDANPDIVRKVLSNMGCPQVRPQLLKATELAL